MTAPVAYRPARFSFAQGSFGVAPITAADLKAHVRIDGTDDDATTAIYIAAAADHVERVTGRLLTERAAVLSLATFPPMVNQEIVLLGGRCASLTSVEYADEAGAPQVLADVYADLVSTPARVGLAGLTTWPAVRAWGLPVTVSYVAGYTTPPPSLLHAVRLLAAEMHERREDAIVGVSTTAAAVSADRLMGPYVIHGMF